MGHIPQNNWEIALHNYIDKYLDKKEIELILLVGSYAVGNNNEYSDIDVYIILKEKIKYRERGNLLVDNYLIEYFKNPLYKVIEYLKNDKRGHGGSMANMILNGKYIYGNKELLKKLRRKAYYYLNKKNKINEQLYYHAWDMYDDYKACKYHKELPYYNALQAIIEAYLYNNDYLLLPPQKIERVFKDEEYRKKYKINKFPNNKFNKLVINCLDNPNEENIDIIYKYVMQDGNFNINNFKLRNKI